VPPPTRVDRVGVGSPALLQAPLVRWQFLFRPLTTSFDSWAPFAAPSVHAAEDPRDDRTESHGVLSFSATDEIRAVLSASALNASNRGHMPWASVDRDDDSTSHVASGGQARGRASLLPPLAQPSSIFRVSRVRLSAVPCLLKSFHGGHHRPDLSRSTSGHERGIGAVGKRTIDHSLGALVKMCASSYKPVLTLFVWAIRHPLPSMLGAPQPARVATDSFRSGPSERYGDRSRGCEPHLRTRTPG
jgi:hypothetical protein